MEGMLGLLKPMISKMLPNVRKSIESQPLDKEKGEFANVIMIQFGEESEGKELPLEFYTCTLAKEEGREMPIITRVTQMEGL